MPGSGDSEIGPDGKVWITYGQNGCGQRGITHVAFELDASGNPVDSCAPGHACFPFFDDFFDDGNDDGSSARIYADWIGVTFDGSPNREIVAIYPDAFGSGQRLYARVMKSGENPEEIARSVNSTLDVETIGGEWILARRNAADTLDIHRFTAGVQDDGDTGGLAELGARSRSIRRSAARRPIATTTPSASMTISPAAAWSRWPTTPATTRPPRRPPWARWSCS